MLRVGRQRAAISREKLMLGGTRSKDGMKTIVSGRDFDDAGKGSADGWSSEIKIRRASALVEGFVNGIHASSSVGGSKGSVGSGFTSISSIRGCVEGSRFGWKHGDN